MKNMIFKYLKKTRINVYMKKTKFGYIAYDNNGPIHYIGLLREVRDIFGLDDRDFVNSVINEWFNSLPIAVNIPNSTNPDVLVFS